jgi:hypothetical protein
MSCEIGASSFSKGARKDLIKFRSKIFVPFNFQLEYNREIRDKTLKQSREDELNRLMSEQISTGQVSIL